MGRTGFLSLMDDKGLLRADLQVQDAEMRAKLTEALAKQEDDNVTVSLNILHIMICQRI